MGHVTTLRLGVVFGFNTRPDTSGIRHKQVCGNKSCPYEGVESRNTFCPHCGKKTDQSQHFYVTSYKPEHQVVHIANYRDGDGGLHLFQPSEFDQLREVVLEAAKEDLDLLVPIFGPFSISYALMLDVND